MSDVDIAKTLEFHRAHGKLATVTIVRAPSRFGTVSVENDARVSRFVEKPLQDSWVNAGFFVLEPQVLDLIEGDETVWERGPLETLAARGELMAYRHDGVFLAIDTYREYLLLNRSVEARRSAVESLEINALDLYLSNQTSSKNWPLLLVYHSSSPGPQVSVAPQRSKGQSRR